MLAIPELTLNLAVLAVLLLAAVSLGYFVGLARLSKQKAATLKLEAEMLQSHAEILQLQRELTEKDNRLSKTPIVSIAESQDNLSDQNPSTRIPKKVAGGGKAKP